MGILSWWKGKEAPEPKANQKTELQRGKSAENSEISGMNGAMEVPRPAEVTVFEFGSAAASTDKVTLAGYCPVSDDLEPCRWEILPASGSNAPQFRCGRFMVNRRDLSKIRTMDAGDHQTRLFFEGGNLLPDMHENEQQMMIYGNEKLTIPIELIDIEDV